MASSELLELIHHGSEERNLEYKASLNWQDSESQAKIIKSVMAMSNIPDGGVIVIGVRKSGSDPAGMEPLHAKSFTLDALLPVINEYAEPFVEMSVTHVIDEEHDSKEFVVIQVQEFAEIPVICKKDHKHENIHAGAVYTRPRRMHESKQVSSQTEMREIIELATIKGMVKRIAELKQLGILFPEPGESADRDRQAFDDQLGDL